MRKNELFYYLLFVVTLIIGIVGTLNITHDALRMVVGGGGFFSGALVLRIIISFPSYQKFLSPILSVLGRLSRSAELESIAYKIQGNLNDYGQKINAEYPNLVPETKLEYIKYESEESFHIDYSGNLILKLHPSKDNTKNLIKATMMQVAKGVIQESRIYVDPKINTSIDLTLSHKILKEQDRNSNLYFRNEVLVPRLSDQELLEYFRCMEILDEKGLFTRLFLRELKQLSVRHGLQLTNLPEIRNDTRNFLNYADTIGRKERGVDVKLDYEGTHIQTGIVMVAKPLIFEIAGVHPYVQRALDKFNSGCEIVYIVGWEPTIRQTESVISYLIMNHEKDYIKDSEKWYYVGGERRLCVAMKQREEHQ